MAGPTHATEQRLPPPRRSPAAVRVVLFGAPYAGKTSLLGALAQAAEKQPRALHFHIRDIPDKLREIRRQVYEEAPRETLEEIVPYAVRVDPPGSPPPFPAVLYDCDGRLANELLSKPQPLDGGQRAGRLAQALLDADALVLVVDASSSEEQIDKDFKEFRRFLELLRSRRAEGREVGGLPVFLALTKCDRLAEPGMTPDQWHDAVAERERSVARRFKEFMGRETEDPFLAFGSIDLDVTGTAIRKPDLRREPGDPTEPVGVAELFRECLEAAARYRERAVRGRRRLLWTLVGTLSLLVVAMAAALLFAVYAPMRQTGLASRVESYRAREGPDAATRLAASAGLPQRFNELVGFLRHPDFPGLSKDLQDFVRARIDELQAYLAFADELRKITRPTEVRSLEELKKIEGALNTRVAPLQAYAREWQQTEAMRFRAHLLEEIATLRHAVADVRAFYQNLKTRGTALLFSRELDADWAEGVRKLWEDEKTPAVPAADAVKRLAFDFDEARPPIHEWEQMRSRLQLVYRMAEALGLIGDPAKAPLVLGDVPAEGDVSLWARDKVLALRKAYPEHDTWSLDPLPDSIRPVIEARLQRSMTQAERAGHRLVLEGLHTFNPTGPEKPAEWQRVADWLLSPGTQAYRELVTILARLLDPTAKDPVAVLAEFLRQTSFELDLSTIRVRIPDNLRDGRLRPDGPLTVRHVPPDGADGTTLTFEKDSEAKPEGVDAIDYTFKLKQGASKLTYRPGDDFWVELKLREGDRPWQFTWWRSSAPSYRFEAFFREARLHPPGEFNAGYFAEGVKLTVVQGKVPTVPALLPQVRFGKQ